MWLFFAFLAVPLIEIGLFIQIGGVLGLWPTLAIVVLTAIAGTWLVRAQGIMAINQLKNSFSRVDDPSEPLAHGAMILVAGALLLTPGFFTDALGFALLMPPIRSALLGYLKTRVKMQHFEMGGTVDQNNQAHASDDVVEGEYYEVKTQKKPTRGSSGWTKH
ncbi:MAG: FxsA family protein [Pseudomonadota bacterium]